MSETATIKITETDLTLRIFKLEDYYPDQKRTRYSINYYPSRLIYLPAIHTCNPFIQKYAYTYFTSLKLEDVMDKIIEILEESKEYNVRVDIIQHRHDQAHLSKEYLSTGTGYVICNKNGVSYNRDLSEREFNSIAEHIKAYYQQQWNNIDKSITES
jgi:hypothetical protein